MEVPTIRVRLPVWARRVVRRLARELTRPGDDPARLRKIARLAAAKVFAGYIGRLDGPDAFLAVAGPHVRYVVGLWQSADAARVEDHRTAEDMADVFPSAVAPWIGEFSNGLGNSPPDPPSAPSTDHLPVGELVTLMDQLCAVRDFAAGRSVEDIADRLGVTVAVVRRVLGERVESGVPS